MHLIAASRLTIGAAIAFLGLSAHHLHVSMRPQPTQPSKTMRTPIAATHSRPVQYSQNRAYGQEAPTPPAHSFLAEGPRASRALSASRASSPPRAVRAVVRLGPHPVADGRLVDVAALAAPSCGLAAYALHAGGLQALAHARAPHRRHVGMRGGQVVVAGEHLAPRAVRAARVRLAPARPVHWTGTIQWTRRIDLLTDLGQIQDTLSLTLAMFPAPPTQRYPFQPPTAIHRSNYQTAPHAGRRRNPRTTGTLSEFCASACPEPQAPCQGRRVEYRSA